jgi:subtilisin family serine protease
MPSFGQPDRRTDTDRLKDLRSIQRQVRSILTTRDDPAFDERLISGLQERRKDRSDRTQFEMIPDKHGGNTLAAAADAQLLVRDMDDPDVSSLLTEVFRLQGVRELADKVVVYGPRPGEQADPIKLAHLASSLRRQGVQISANYMTPMGGRVKFVASPEKTEGDPPQFPDGGEQTQKSPVRVVIIDTGVYGHLRSDGWLRDLDKGHNREVLDDSPQGGDGFLDLAAGHGSFCAGIVQQIVPEADIVVRNTLDTEGFGTELDVAKELVREVKKGLEAGQHVVVNLSLGAETADDERPVALGVALEIIDEESRKAGHETIVVAAAGNYGHDRPCYPAAFPTVTAVAAVTQGLLPAEWSSRGAWVDVCTIGEGVRSTFVPGKESPATDYRFEVFEQDPFALWSGTSFAAPQVAGAIAKIAIDDDVTPIEAKRRLLEDAKEIPLYGKRVEILPHI